MTELKYKPTGLTFQVKKVRASGKVELANGVVIPKKEFELNWEVLK